MSTPVFYLKVNAVTEFAVKCFEHWVDIVNSYGADYYVVCDKDELKEMLGSDSHKFIKSSQDARELLKDIVAPAHWVNVGAALLTPFYHAEKMGFECIFNIDADDIVMYCEPQLCAKALKKVKKHADSTNVNCFSLDMHSTTFERFIEGGKWTFGVTYTKLNIDYISIIKDYCIPTGGGIG